MSYLFNEGKVEVTIVQRPKQLMNPFDADMASFIHNEVRKHGVKLALGYSVEGFVENGTGIDVLLKENAPLHTDMVVLAIGVTPESALAREAGLALGIKNSILVNDRMETSIPDIYAVGDAVQVKHYVTGEGTLIALAACARAMSIKLPMKSWASACLLLNLPVINLPV